MIQKRILPALTKEQLEVLIKYCRCERDKTLITLLWYSGMRISEAVGLRAGDFNWEEGTVEEFLGKRGFYQVEDMKAQSLDNIYFKGTNRKSSPCWAVVHATVKQREQIPLLRIPSYPVIISHSLPIK